MIHADYWTQASGWEYPQGSIMSPYIGSQDTRALHHASRATGAGPRARPGIPYNQWTNIAGPAADSSEPYGAHRARAGVAPRAARRADDLLRRRVRRVRRRRPEQPRRSGAETRARSRADEQATLALRSQGRAGAARSCAALRRGAVRPRLQHEPGRPRLRAAGRGGRRRARGISRLDTPTTVTTALPASLGIADGTVLHDHMGGPDVTVSGGAISVTLGAQGAAILAP